MTRILTKLLTAVFVLGCGSSAMANPDRGQWTGYGSGYDPTVQPHAGPPAVAMDGDRGQPGQSAPPAAQGCPDQQVPQAEAEPEPEEDEDMAEPDTWEPGQIRLGVMVMSMTPELRRHFGAPNDAGVLIARVEPESAASHAGIQAGDVLLRVGRQQVRSGNDVVQALAEHGGGKISLLVIRQGRLVRISAMLPGPRRPPQPLEPPAEQPI